MSAALPPPPAANDGTPAEAQVGLAFEAARQQLVAVLANPEFRGDAVSAFIGAIAATIDGLAAVYEGLRASANGILTRAQVQQRDVAASIAAQRDDFTRDLERIHAAALSRLKAEELAQEARIRAGLIDAAKFALQDLLRADRRGGRWRSLGIAGAAVVGVLALGFGAGWYYRGAEPILADEREFHAAAETAQTLSLFAERFTRGMTAADLLAMENLNMVIAPNVVGPARGEEVPAPCIAKVPDGTIVNQAGRAVPACVVAVKETVQMRGGDFLIQAINARTSAQ